MTPYFWSEVANSSMQGHFFSSFQINSFNIPTHWEDHLCYLVTNWDHYISHTTTQLNDLTYQLPAYRLWMPKWNTYFSLKWIFLSFICLHHRNWNKGEQCPAIQTEATIPSVLTASNQQSVIKTLCHSFAPVIGGEKDTFFESGT